MLTITHTHEEGTLIEGTSRGDGTAEVLKSCGWRWGRSIGSWFVPQSRDRLPKHHVIRRTVDALEAAGFEVGTEISTEVRDAATVEADKIARQADRVEALEAKAARRAGQADAAWEKHRRDVDRLPEGGEPIKIGHHSENRHRRSIEKAHASMGQSVQADREAEYAAQRAATAANTTGARYNPVTVANRIEKLAAEIRKIERDIVSPRYDAEKGYRPATEDEKAAAARRFAPHLEELRGNLTYWEGVRAEQIASGQATNYSRETVKPGDYVRIRGHWHKVVRSNVKTVTVETEYSWTDKSPWHEVQAHKSAEEVAAAKTA